MKCNFCYVLMFSVDVPEDRVKEILSDDVDFLEQGSLLNLLGQEHSDALKSAVYSADGGEIASAYVDREDPLIEEFGEILWEN